MSASIRMAPAKTPAEYINIERPNSNFDFAESRFPELNTLQRILSQARVRGCKTIVVENLEDVQEIVEEDEDLRILDAEFVESSVCRLSFLTQTVSSSEDLSTCTDKDIIGYAVIKKDVFQSRVRSRVFESVVAAPRHPNNFIKGSQTWNILVDRIPFRTKGFLYAQQNGISNCCAHVALRTASAAFTNSSISYREINSILGIDLKARTPGDGLDTGEMVRVLEHIGARCFVADYRSVTSSGILPPPFQKYVYGSIESGYPAIISFETTTHPGSFHAIPIFGHTFNSDTWVPSAERSYFQIGSGTRYIPSESWVSMYIGHDDNWGSHYCIPRHYFQTHHPITSNSVHGTVSSIPSECVVHVISTVPQEVEVSPIRAEAIGVDYLLALRPEIANLQHHEWAKRLTYHADNQLLVIRPILITVSEYAGHLSKIQDWKQNRIHKEMIEILNDLPDAKLWLIELSIPELFSANLRKVGEVLVYAEKALGSNRDLSGFFLARLPGYFALLEDGDTSNPKFSFIESGATEHVELYGCEEG